MTEGNAPEKRFSTGAINATVWKNKGTSKKDGQEVEYRTISIERRYKDKNDQWQSTTSLRVNDLPKAALVLQEAYKYIVLRDTENQGSSKFAPVAEDSQDVTQEEIVM